MDGKQDQPLRLSVPTLTGRVSPDLVASTLARLVASGAADTQVDLVRTTGLARTTVSAALDRLAGAGVLRHDGTRPVAGRGRPADRFALAAGFGQVLVVDVGVTATRLSVHDLAQGALGETETALAVTDGPTTFLERITAELRRLLQECAPDSRPLVLVVGLPGPMDTRRGVPVKPPIMPGWDGFPVADTLSAAFDCPVLVENDANLRALGEARALPTDQSPLLYLKVGTGIGGGLVTATGDLHHGADGAAGDIGHVRVPDADDELCTCGNRGCVEAVASASAVLRQLQRTGTADDPPPSSLEEVGAALRAGDARTVQLVREAATRVGEVVANLVHFFNPARVVVGGFLALSSDDVLAGVRAVVYRRALPLATRNLVISPPVLGRRSGTAGGVVLGVEHVLTEDVLGEALARGGTRR